VSLFDECSTLSEIAESHSSRSLMVVIVNSHKAGDNHIVARDARRPNALVSRRPPALRPAETKDRSMVA